MQFSGQKTLRNKLHLSINLTDKSHRKMFCYGRVSSISGNILALSFSIPIFSVNGCSWQKDKHLHFIFNCIILNSKLFICYAYSAVQKSWATPPTLLHISLPRSQTCLFLFLIFSYVLLPDNLQGDIFIVC